MVAFHHVHLFAASGKPDRMEHPRRREGVSTPTNWPNPERPGVPLFPERSWRHYVGESLLFWYSDIQRWVTFSPIQGCKKPEAFAGDKYHGPVLTPTQIAELLAGERERCANVCKTLIACDENQYGVGLKTTSAEARIKALSEAQRLIRNLGDAL